MKKLSLLNILSLFLISFNAFSMPIIPSHDLHCTSVKQKDEDKESQLTLLIKLGDNDIKLYQATVYGASGILEYKEKSIHVKDLDPNDGFFHITDLDDEIDYIYYQQVWGGRKNVLFSQDPRNLSAQGKSFECIDV